MSDINSMNDTMQLEELIWNGDVLVKNGAPDDFQKKEPVKRPQASLIEKIAAIAIWPVAYVYSNFLLSFGFEGSVSFGIFVILFMGLAEAFYFKRKRTAESWIFMVLTLMSAVSACFPLGHVWEDGACAFFTQLFLAYWVLCRSDRLAEGETSHMFLWDGITAFFVMTFKNFHLDVRAIILLFAGSAKGEGKKRNVGGAIIGIVIGIILLCIAVARLKNADENFGNLLDRIAEIFAFEISFKFVAQCFLSIFFAMYFYGLLGGCYRETREHVELRSNRIKDAIATFRKVPGITWVVLIGLFTVFYLVFFGLQGSYLFNAFSMTLPTQYTYSEYARKGFGDMCGVMVVNLIVTWLTTRTSLYGENEGIKKAVKIATACLTVESIFFAVIAALKLLMYIDAYGFTPLRLQSVWLVVILAYACVCILVSLFTGKKTAKFWFVGSAALLAVLCLV